MTYDCDGKETGKKGNYFMIFHAGKDIGCRPVGKPENCKIVVCRPPKHLVSEAHFRRQLFKFFYICSVTIQFHCMHAQITYTQITYINYLLNQVVIYFYLFLLHFWILNICNLKVTENMTINSCILWKYSLLDHVILKP